MNKIGGVAVCVIVGWMVSVAWTIEPSAGAGFLAYVVTSAIWLKT